MRLDKFLKISRIIKRRQVAKEVADKGRIQVQLQRQSRRCVDDSIW